jgi:hypothetical protein
VLGSRAILLYKLGVCDYLMHWSEKLVSCSEATWAGDVYRIRVNGKCVLIVPGERGTIPLLNPLNHQGSRRRQ